MSKMIANENNYASIKKCAFCQNWYDPTNSAIDLKYGKIWEYDPQIHKRCRVNNANTRSSHTCSKFISKI